MSINILNVLGELLEIKDVSLLENKLLNKMIDDKEKRNEFIKSFLEKVEIKLDEDIFFEYFMTTRANTKGNAQYFTPPSLCKLVSEINGDTDDNTTCFVSKKVVYDECCGTGGLLIAEWYKNWKGQENKNWEKVKYDESNTYINSDSLKWDDSVLYVGEDISSNIVPYFLFNMFIRKINAELRTKDIINNKTYKVYKIWNDEIVVK